jgi:hypothetical protein
MPFFDAGNALIHCTHGADRTGFMVAEWLSRGANAKLMVEAKPGMKTTAQASPWQTTMPGTEAELKTGKDPSYERLWKYAKRFNSWETYLCQRNNGIPFYTRSSKSGKITEDSNDNIGYAKYLDAFYPFKVFCKNHPNCYGAGACSNPEAHKKLGVTPGATAKSPWGGGKFETRALAAASGEKCVQSKCSNSTGCPGKEGKDWGWVESSGAWYAQCGKHKSWRQLQKEGKV